MTSARTTEIPDWIIESGEIRSLIDELRHDVGGARERFRSYPDVREAVAFRERSVAAFVTRIGEINRLIDHLNLVAPHMRFRRGRIDVGRETEPIARAYFWPGG